MVAHRRRHKTKKKRQQNFTASLKIYVAILLGCFAIAGIVSYVTGTLPGMARETMNKAISSQIAKQVGGIDDIDSAKQLLINAGGGTSDGSGIDLKKLKNSSKVKNLMKQYGK